MPNSAWQNFLMVVGVALGIMIIPSLVAAVHESGHVLAAIAFGVPVEKITVGKVAKKANLYAFNLLGVRVLIKRDPDGGRTEYKEGEYDWHKMFIISLAGPLTSYLVGLAIVFTARSFYNPSTSLAALASAVLLLFAIANIFAAVSNCLPITRSDGTKAIAILLKRLTITKRSIKSRVKKVQYITCCVWLVASFYAIHLILVN